ncbi:MazG nucleotide pyrophosphohydrolase [mine drainage metagenome]|uniref:MazG nucleotide pyrophosphohydrolase n=1 Tax=mine drainage metagenome TaxID=410659 RepID=T1CG20_9ZZZZ
MTESKEIHLPKLDGLTPTMESTALKLMEEAGELGAAIGKVRGMSGERVVMEDAAALRHVAEELLDVAQTAVTMMFVLEEHHGVHIGEILDTHIAKLVRKGYLRRA